MLKGDIDFELENIFQKVKIVSLDQIIIWKGLDISSEIKTRAESRDPRISNTSLSPAPLGASRPESKLEAEYALRDGKSLAVVAKKEESGQQIVTIGPKVRF